MDWRQRAVELGLAAATAVVIVRYGERLLHRLRRLTRPPTPIRYRPTLLGRNFPKGFPFVRGPTPPGYMEPLWPDPSALIFFSREDGSFNVYGLLRSFTPKPGLKDFLKIHTHHLVKSHHPGPHGVFFFAINDARVPWGVVLAFTPVPHIVKGGHLHGVTPDLVGEQEDGDWSETAFDLIVSGLLFAGVRPNGDVFLFFGRHINLDSRLTLVRLAPTSYGWDTVARITHTVPNHLLCFDIAQAPELGRSWSVGEADGVLEVFQELGHPTLTAHILTFFVDLDQHLITHRLINADELQKWRSRMALYLPPRLPGYHTVGSSLMSRDFADVTLLSVDKKQRLWQGSSSRPLTLRTLAFLAFARKYHTQLDHLASLPRGLESIGIPESIVREYRRQLAWTMSQPSLILDFTVSTPVLKSQW